MGAIDWIVSRYPSSEGPINDLIELWTTQRTSLLLGAFFLLLLVRLYLHSDGGHEGLVAIPKIYEGEKRGRAVVVEVETETEEVEDEGESEGGGSGSEWGGWWGEGTQGMRGRWCEAKGKRFAG
ncbi:uncharacterized protein DNG_08573 [Cephalotrichum gorgonifer]|uniref:Uncharacterized protein n=1 Tax=Cephalotrichum gorgonifer TaxID=2041049 RepID=A0AAE8N5I7_9PEZI|nr:uncharacterized protein DNG_08573 [Cephalotrichum gorgonifer]